MIRNVVQATPPKRLLAFVLLQAVLLGATATWAARLVVREQVERALPPLRETPLSVLPQFDYPEVVSDAQLKLVLDKLRPRLRGPNPKINDIDHAMRCWGADAVFDDADCLSGEEMRKLLLDHHEFAQLWDRPPAPLLMDNGIGVRTRVQEGGSAASHTDHLLAGQAEVGTPLDYPVVTARRTTTFRALLEQSLRDFSLNQGEHEWSALTYALFLPPTSQWRSTEGQWITFDRLAHRLMRQSAEQGVCFGNHRLHGLVMLLRVDDQQTILSSPVRTQILAYLTDMTARFVRNQHPDGYFNGRWPGPELPAPPEGAVSPDSQGGRLLATGHVLEWWALAPAELHPPRESLVRAGQWIARTISELSETDIRNSYTFLTHAGRALALWRGRNPADYDDTGSVSSSASDR